MLDLNKPADVGCRIFTSRMSDVGVLQVGCRILTSRMSDFYKSDVECRIFKVGCRMAPISVRTFVLIYEQTYPESRTEVEIFSER